MKTTTPRARTHNTTPDVAASPTAPIDGAQRIALHDDAENAFNRISGQIAIVKALIDVAADGDSFREIPMDNIEFTTGLMALFERVMEDVEVVRAEMIRCWNYEFEHRSLARGAR